MIYVQIGTSSYSFDGHIDFTSTQSGYQYHIPFTAMNGAGSTGFLAREINISIPSTVDFNPFDIEKISLDNLTWYDVYFVEEMRDSTRPNGWTGMYSLKAYISFYRYGTVHTSSSKWGLTSVDLTQGGNYPAPVKLSYYAPRYFFPLSLDLIDFAGSSITFTRASSKDYGGVAYSANEPIFDEGLYIGGDDNAQLTLNKDFTDYVLFLILRKKGGDYTGTILDNNTQGWKIHFKDVATWAASTDYALGDYVKPTSGGDYIYKCTTAGTSGSSEPAWGTTVGGTTDDNTVVWTCKKWSITLSGTTDLDVTFPSTDYTNGSPVAIILSSSGGTNYLACGVYDETNHTITSPATGNNTDTITLNLNDVIYIGNDGTNFLQGDSISNLILFDYYETSPETLTWNLTTTPLRWNDFYIANKTAGTITYDGSKLTDENGNDITGLVSGILLEVKPSETATIEMTEGLSAKWKTEVKDTFRSE